MKRQILVIDGVNRELWFKEDGKRSKTSKAKPFVENIEGTEFSNHTAYIHKDIIVDETTAVWVGQKIMEVEVEISKVPNFRF